MHGRPSTEMIAMIKAAGVFGHAARIVEQAVASAESVGPHAGHGRRIHEAGPYDTQWMAVPAEATSRYGLTGEGVVGGDVELGIDAAGDREGVAGIFRPIGVTAPWPPRGRVCGKRRGFADELAEDPKDLRIAGLRARQGIHASGPSAKARKAKRAARGSQARGECV